MPIILAQPQQLRSGVGRLAESDGEGGTDYDRRRVKYTQGVNTRADAGADTLIFGKGILLSDLLLKFVDGNLQITFRNSEPDPSSDFADTQMISGDMLEIVNWGDERDRIENIPVCRRHCIGCLRLDGKVIGSGRWWGHFSWLWQQ